MGGKYKIAFGIREGKAQFLQLLLCPFPCGNNLCQCLSEIVFRFNTGNTRPQSRQIHRIGIKGKLHIAQIRNQFFTAKGKPDPHTRHGAGFGKSADNQQIVVFFKERQHTHSPKIDIGFVHNDHRLPVGPDDMFHCFRRLQDTGRRIGIGENDAPPVSLIVRRIDGKISPKGTHLIGNTEQLRPYIIKRIRNIGKQDRFSSVKKSQKTQSQHIIRTDSHKYLLFLQTEITGQTFPQDRNLRVRVQAVFLWSDLIYSLCHGRRRRIGILVRIQFDNIRASRLLSRRIGNRASDILFPAHCFLLT